MSEEPTQDLTPVLAAIREITGELAEFRHEMNERFDALERLLDKYELEYFTVDEDLLAQIRQDLSEIKKQRGGDIPFPP